jgi:molybdate transport system permease protein
MRQFRRIRMDTTTSLLASTDWFPLGLSLKVSAVATLLALIAGVALAWVFSRKRFPGRSVLEAVFMLPLVLPPTVLGYGILVLAGRRSPLGAWLREHLDYTIIFSWHGAVVASAVVALPLVLKSASAAFAGVGRASWPGHCSRLRAPWVNSAPR